MSGHATDSQISAFLVLLHLRQKDAEPTVVAACSAAMCSYAYPVPYTGHDHLQDLVVDSVGTGGDGHDTYNVSTTASIVAAGAGAKVAKHGNRSASSSSGSADLMEAHGCKIHAVEPEQVADIINRTGFCFLFSQKYHPAMKHVAALRKEIGIPTVFNVLGPMSNPARPRRMMVGVYKPEMGGLMANALRLTGVRNALVVCGAESLDEISPAGETTFWCVNGSNAIVTGTLHPTRDFGLPTHPLSHVKGGDCQHNAQLLKQLLNGELPENHPILDYVLLNAAAVLVVAGVAGDYKEGVAKARLSIQSGEAKRVLEAFRQETCTSTPSS
ncbi:anthranilate phosphoribosyltransferase [Spinellus fusiger]|nr:anthranilate phosphoribosyltransferase [Spinellus fusiger]